MKKLFIILATLFAFVACDEEGNIDPGTLDGLVIDAKWILDNSDYESFEFNDTGDYIVVYNTSSTTMVSAQSGVFTAPKSVTRSDDGGDSVLLGEYESDGDYAINMIGFGRLELTSVESENVSFSLTLEGESETVSYSANIASVVASSDNTTLLCRKWDLISYTEDGVDIGFDEGDAENVLFSKAGTYLIEYRDGDTGLAQWKWKSESDKTIYYTWDGDWRENSYVTLTTLNSSKLVVEETYEDGEVSVTTLTPSK